MKKLSNGYNSREIPIKDLHLDIDNKRWEKSAKDENEAIEKVIETNGIKKAQEMVDDFAGETSSIHLPLLAIEINKQIIVKEGNRRLFALKFLSKSFENSKLRRDYSTITKNTLVPVNVYYDEKVLKKAMEAINGPRTSGASQQPFNPVQKYSENYKTRPLLAVWNDLKNEFPYEKLEEPKNVTNFEEIVRPHIESFGVEFVEKNNTVKFDKSKTKQLKDLMIIASQNKITKIRSDDEIKQEISRVIKGDSGTKPTKVYDGTLGGAKKPIKKAQHLLLVSDLSKITQHVDFHAFAKKLTEIHYNGVNLRVSIPLYRVILDFSIRFYCDQNGIATTKLDNKTKKVTIDKNLSEIIKDAITHMKSNGLEKAFADTALSNLTKAGSNSMTYLNKSTHNYNYSLSLAEFKDIKNMFDPIIKHIIG